MNIAFSPAELLAFVYVANQTDRIAHTNNEFKSVTGECNFVFPARNRMKRQKIHFILLRVSFFFINDQLFVSATAKLLPPPPP